METNEKELTGYPSVDKPWLKYYDSDESVMNNVTETHSIYDYLIQQELPMDSAAIYYYGKKITYRQVLNQIEISKNNGG